ncbi:MurR/RpiR family transcriptional regulator [Dongia sp.]|uniref:MurR/RpiR family transcriptional regulator n=1 Tax=Dongia sp. TaxID=1977262 RepID=UPI0035ADC0DB
MERNYESLKQEIAERHDQLPKRLLQIAQFTMEQPDFVALETVANIADKAKVQPSSLIRFAKLFGFDGFSDMQQVFRSRLIDRVVSYGERIRAAESDDAVPPSDNVLEQLIAADANSLERLRRDVPPADLERVAELLANARIVGVTAQRRSFPVASYLSYALSHLGQRAVLLDSIGGMSGEQARLLSAGDALIAVSFTPYAPETLSVVGQAKAQGAKIIAITDKGLSPLVSLADIRFEVEEAQIKGIRSPTATTSLAVAIILALGHRLEAAALKRQPSGRSKR